MNAVPAASTAAVATRPVAVVPARRLGARLLRRPAFDIGVFVLLSWTVVAVFGSLIEPYPPDQTNVGPVLAPPSLAHLAGTDDLGRDVLSRVLAGAQDVLIVAPLATALGLAGGITIGLVAGYRRGITDSLLMRASDLLMALPFVIVAVLVVSSLGPSLVTLIVIIGVLFMPLIGRTVRSATMQVSRSDYVAAARMRGERSPYIMLRELLPNIAPAVTVEATVRLGYAVFTAASLAFLGVGLQPPSPDWGLTVYSERLYLQTAPWTVLAPAAAIASLVVAVNLVADALRREMATR